MQDTDLMLHTLLELGESMLADGADVRRVEQTLSRMGKAYGAVRMDVFVITSSIVLTMTARPPRRRGGSKNPP